MNNIYFLGKVESMSKLCFDLENKFKPYITMCVFDEKLKINVKITNENLMNFILKKINPGINVCIYGYMSCGYIYVREIEIF